MSEGLWRINLLGSLCACRDAAVITRFRTYKTGVLLAYLAADPTRAARREELIELLWPEISLARGRNNLRMALTALRQMFSGPSGEDGEGTETVILADRTHVQLDPQLLTTDKLEFEALVRKAGRIESEEESARCLRKAAGLYRGEFLSDYGEAWVQAERQRLADAYLLAVRRLVKLLVKFEDKATAVDYAHRAVEADPLREDSHRQLIQLYALTGQSAAALRQYQAMERLLWEELGERPSSRAQALLAQISGAAPGPATDKSGRSTSVITAALPSSPLPPPRPHPSTRLRPAKLPVPLSPFLGREDDLAQAEEMLRTPQTRLITLTGLGGSGKTRLALALAERMRDHFEDAVWFVSLAGLSQPQPIMETIAQALLPSRAGGLAPEEQIAQALGEAPGLLVLDNLEHLLPHAARVVWTLLETIPNLICLVTSRQRLNLTGEYEYGVGPLATPLVEGTPERLAEFASVQLFVDRARAARPDFVLTRENAPFVAALCRHLEGVPLAIELAAAQSHVLAPKQLQARLTPRFPLLVNRACNAPPRHASLKTAMEWSYNLLSPPLQCVFACLSVLRGSWSLEAAEQVCGLEAPGSESSDISAFMLAFPAQDAMETLQAVRDLRERSLLCGEEVDEEVRFRMLETVREYAGEQLSKAEVRGARLRLSRYCLQMAAEAEIHLSSAASEEWLSRLERDQDNLRATLHFLLEAHAHASSDLAEQGLRLAASLACFWYVRGSYREGCDWLERALFQAANAPSPLRMKALLGLGNLLYARQELARADEVFAEHLRLARLCGEARSVAVALSSQANVAKAQGDFEAARRLREESLCLFRQVGDTRGIALSFANLANLLTIQDDHSGAEALHRESLALFRGISDKPNIVLELNNLAHVALQRGCMQAAHACLSESLGLAQQINSCFGLTQALLNLSVFAGRRRHLQTAAELLGRAELQLEQSNVTLAPCERAELEKERVWLEQASGAPRFADAWQRGRAVGLQQIICLAEEELAKNLE